MAAFFERLRRLRRLPTRVLLHKIAARLLLAGSNIKNRGRDGLLTTFSGNRSIPPLQSFLESPASVFENPWAGEVTEKYLHHCFDLLGSGWVTVAHGGSYPGFESHHYGPGTTVAVDAKGHWLDARVTLSNRKEARCIWSLVSTDYVPIDWHVDFRSGYRWSERTWFRDIKFGHPEGADVKVPWELARMQHLVSFAYVYSQSADGADLRERALCEFCDQVLDFVATNPPRFGINWNCAMEVAIRISNILLAQDLFRASGAKFSLEFEALLSRTTFEHGKHIWDHMEWNPELRGNHYLANLAGLMFVGSYLAPSTETAQWIDFSCRELLTELELQFNGDGANFEASTCYHALSAEILIFAAALMMRQGKGLPEDFLGRLHRIARFLADVAEDGRIMQIGDNDSGRFAKLCPKWEQNLAGELFEDFLDVDPIKAAYAGILSGEESSCQQRSTMARLVLQQLAGSAPPPPGAPAEVYADDGPLCRYSDFGVYIYKRDWGRLTVRCGPVGQNGNGGHAHNDQLSIQLECGAAPFFVDPGTYVYTASAAARNLFRSTAMHNTLSVTYQEQCDWYAGLGGLFSLKKDRAQAQAIETGPDRFVGQHYGFGSPHRRTIDLAERMVTVTDEYDSPLEASIHLHLHPAVETEETPDGIMLRNGHARIKVSANNNKWHIANSLYSSGYGKKVLTRQLLLRPIHAKTVWRFALL